jgi:hypothetical protein
MRQLLTIRHWSDPDPIGSGSDRIRKAHLNGAEKTTDRSAAGVRDEHERTLVHYNEAVERGFVPGAVVSG